MAVDRDLLRTLMGSHPRVRSLTVTPPWSLALVRGWKPVENRTQNLAGTWRGRVLILSGAMNWDDYGAWFIGRHAPRPVEGPDEPPVELSGPVEVTREECHPGHYIGAADLVDVHKAVGAGAVYVPGPDPGFRHVDGCCAPWGQQPGVWRGKTLTIWHYVFENPVEFAEPIKATGHLGLRWVTDPAYIRAAWEGIAA